MKSINNKSNIQISNIAVSSNTNVLLKKKVNNSNNKDIMLKPLKIPKIMSFEERLKSNIYLESHDASLPPPKIQDKEVIAFKKNNQLNKYLQKSYAQRQSLVIPELSKERRSVDISKNIIESKPKPEIACIGIQSDEFKPVDLTNPNNKNTNNYIYNKIKANEDNDIVDGFNLYLEKNAIAYVDDTMDIDKTNQISTQNYIPQKTGKDVSTQIEDGDLFDFDIDCIPILDVITNKILEQSQLELCEEFELNNLREIKAKFNKKILDEKARNKKIEIEEINKKKDIDALLKIKYIDKLNKVTPQQKLLARVNAKNYLRNLKFNCYLNLKSFNYFNNLTNNISNEYSLKQFNKNTNNILKIDKNLDETVADLYKDNVLQNNYFKHRYLLENRRLSIERDKQLEIQRQKEAEVLAEIKLKERNERRYKKRVKKLRDDIKTNVIKNAQKKLEFFNDDYILNVNGGSELDENLTAEDIGSYIGLFGGIITSLVATVCSLNLFVFPNNDNYFNQDVISEWINLMSQEFGRIIIKVKLAAEKEVKKAINLNNSIKNSNTQGSHINNSNISNSNNNSDNNNEENEEINNFDIKNIRYDNNNLSGENIEKIIDICSKFDYCGEEYLVKIVEEIKKKEDLKIKRNTNLSKDIALNTNTSIDINKNNETTQDIKYSSYNIIESYELIMKALLSYYIKGNDKIIINYLDKPVNQNLSEYFINHFKSKKAYVLISPSDDFIDILESASYFKDRKKPKLKIPQIDVESKIARVYTPTVSHISPINNVDYGYSLLIEDQNAEFYISLKLLEFYLKALINKYDSDFDSKYIYVKFYQEFNNLITSFRNSINLKNNTDTILYFDIPIFEEDEDENAVMKEESNNNIDNQ